MKIKVNAMMNPVWSTRDRRIVYRPPASLTLLSAISDCLGYDRQTIVFRRALAHVQEMQRCPGEPGFIFVGMMVLPISIHNETTEITKREILLRSGITGCYSVRHIGSHAYYRLYSVCHRGGC